ncbi:MAG TPA: acyltransferase family protein [Anaerolineales bacterium]|nr:acyltransferase family protein [Anaerolineales bacterium]
MLGNEVRQVSSEKTFTPILLLIGTGIGLLLLNFFFSYSTDIAKRVYESLAVNTLEAVLGILFILALSRQVELHAQWLAAPLKYIGNITLIILLFHVPIQGFWGDKIMALTNSFPSSILVGFIMGILGPILIYEIFIRFNPVASFWFGRKAELPRQKEHPIQGERMADSSPNSLLTEVKEQ